MSDRVFLLLHSPLLGPVSWHPLRDELRGRGHRAVVPDLVGAVTGRPPHIPAIARSVVSAIEPDAQPVTVLAHSGAGGLVPAVVAAAPDTVATVVFVDATLPYPGRSWFQSAPPDLGDRLRALAGDDGVLPPWPTWFGPGAVAELVPDPVARDRLCADVPRVPLSYLTEAAPADDRWRRVPSCYLRLSDGYLDAAVAAAGQGWPAEALPDSHHLSGYTHPDRMIAALDSLLARLDAG